MHTIFKTVAAAAALALAAATTASGSVELTGPGTVRIADIQVKHIHVDVGSRARGAGDVDIYRQLLFNLRITAKPIGHADVVCIDTGSDSSSCTGTYFLPKGKIMVGGVIGSRLIYELAVLGGTGFYANVRGTLTATSLSQRPPKEFLLFRLIF